MKAPWVSVAAFWVMAIAALASRSQAQEERRKEEIKVISCWGRCGAAHASCLKEGSLHQRDRSWCSSRHADCKRRCSGLRRIPEKMRKPIVFD